jgi:hypothetical protein
MDYNGNARSFQDESTITWLSLDSLPRKYSPTKITVVDLLTST